MQYLVSPFFKEYEMEAEKLSNLLEVLAMTLYHLIPILFLPTCACAACPTHPVPASDFSELSAICSELKVVFLYLLPPDLV